MTGHVFKKMNEMPNFPTHRPSLKRHWLQDEAQRDHGIRLTGFVDNIHSVLAEYPIMVNAMRIGSGLKNKVLEAFAMGLAVGSTGLGIEAISTAREGVDHIRAD